LQHLQVVCILRLHGVCGRSTTIFYLAFKELSASLIRDTPHSGRVQKKFIIYTKF
jgi:hypothetical protein